MRISTQVLVAFAGAADGVPVRRWVCAGAAGVLVLGYCLYMRGWLDLVGYDWEIWQNLPVLSFDWPERPDPIWMMKSLLSVPFALWACWAVNEIGKGSDGV